MEEDVRHFDEQTAMTQVPRTTRTTVSNFKFAFVLTTLFAIWVLFVCFHHECWRDEADAWLAARDMNPLQLFRWLGGAGTPGLWYLLLMPLAKLGLPYFSMTLLHALLAIVAAGLIAFLSPFPKWVRGLIVFSYLFSYEYAVVARSYVLTVLLLFLIAIALRRRRYWLLGIWLFLLFNTNALGFVIATATAMAVAFDVLRAKRISRSVATAACIALLGFILAFIQLLPAAKTPAPNKAAHWDVIGDSFSEMFLPHFPAYIGFYRRHSHGKEWIAQGGYWTLRVLTLLLFLTILFRLRHSPAAVATVLLSLPPLFYIYVFKWYGGERHAGMLFVLLIFALWTAGWPASWNWKTFASSPARQLDLIALTASLLFSCAVALVWGYRDIRYPYSGAKPTAIYVRDHSLQSLPIAAVPSPQCEALLPYLPHMRFWYVGREEYGTFTQWDETWLKEFALSEDEIVRRVHRQFGTTAHLLLMASKPLAHPQQHGYTLLFHSPAGFANDNGKDEEYYLYLASPPPSHEPESR